MNSFTINDYNAYNNCGWGTGFELGVAADLNIKNYLSIQPGFFFKSRSNSYNLASNLGSDVLYPYSGAMFFQAGKLNSYHFTIPIMARFHFNVTDDLIWNVEAGPYVSLGLSSKLKNKVCYLSLQDANLNANEAINIPDGVEFKQHVSGTNFGLKMGTGITVLRRYVFSVAYQAGISKPWKEIKFENMKYNYGGRSKLWSFTVGYIF